MSLLDLTLNTLFAALAALGFAILFNVPVRTLAGCAVAGALAYLTRMLLQQVGVGVELASLAGAAAVGLLAEFFARRWRTPRTIFSVSGIIPLIPGSLAFQALMGLVQLSTPDPETFARLNAALLDILQTGLILTALAMGIAAPRLLFQRRRPVV